MGYFLAKTWHGFSKINEGNYLSDFLLLLKINLMNYNDIKLFNRKLDKFDLLSQYYL